jgi:AraC-like DNA-binding protein
VTDELWQAFVQITGAANALILGSVLVFGPRLHRTRSRKKLGWALIAYAYLLFSFTAVENAWFPAVWWVWLVDYVVVLFASALFLDYMSDAVGRGSVSRLWYLSPVLFVLLAALMGREFIAGPAISVVILVQLAYSCVTTWLYIAYGQKLATRAHHLYVLLIGLWILHAFQLALMVAPTVGWLFDAVPLIGAALMIALTILVITDPRSLRSLAQVTPSQNHPTLTLQTIDQYMQTERPHLDPRLSLDDLAKALGIAARDLSQFIKSSDGGNFYQFVNGHRVAEAKRLLTDPAEHRTSIEAIGLMAGFRSRSTFYDSFRRETGQTPAQYRNTLTNA